MGTLGPKVRFGAPDVRSEAAPATPPRPRRPASRRWRGRTALWLCVHAALIAAFAFPFAWVLVTSLNTSSEVFSFPPSFLPHWQWDNYVRAWEAAPWVQYFLNTIFIASTTVLLVLVTSVLAGFAFGALRFPGRNVLFFVVLSALMIPPTVLLIPDYIILKDINWLDTYWAQIVPWGASVFGIFLVRQFVSTLPGELADAAEIDGAGSLRYLWSVVVPMLRPALVTIALYVGIGSWNSFVWPFIMTSSPAVQPIEVGLATFYGTNGTDWTQLSAAAVFTTLPVLVVFLVAQRQFLAGAFSTVGGFKG